jgi:outer membrane biosynthesis protein TonB
VTQQSLNSPKFRSPNARPRLRGRRLFLSCAASLACHIVAVTLLAGRPIRAQETTPLDGAISVYPNAAADPLPPVESPPPSTAPANRPKPPRKVMRPREHRLPAPARARLAKAAPTPTRPDPVPVTLTAARPGEGASVQAPPTRRKPTMHLSAGVARSLRIHDSFPRMPDLLRAQHRVEVVHVEVCVSETGTVDKVRLEDASPTLEKALREAIVTWRYRPLLLRGEPNPFCHTLQLTYRS